MLAARLTDATGQVQAACMVMLRNEMTGEEIEAGRWLITFTPASKPELSVGGVMVVCWSAGGITLAIADSGRLRAIHSDDRSSSRSWRLEAGRWLEPLVESRDAFLRGIADEEREAAERFIGAAGEWLLHR